MFKRTIAIALSAVLCASAVTSGSYPGLYQKGSGGSSSADVNASDAELKATNSLGKYFQETIEDKNKVQKLSFKNDLIEGQFEITALDFDPQTGDIHVFSTQSESCTVEVDFFDDESNKLITSTQINVEKGEVIESVGHIDTLLLPEYFVVKAHLLDRFGTRLCADYTRTQYTEKVHEFIATDINDFDSDKVVNFDESENTNFIVLSDDTVKVDVSEDKNQLISVDYDNNIYKFENADEILLNVENGQYLYCQPNEEDIIAIKVNDISTKNNITTIKGNNDIQEMFDFVKFESVSTVADGVVDNSDTGIGYEIQKSEDGSDDKIVVDSDDLAYHITQEMQQYNEYNYSDTVTGIVSDSFPLQFGPDNANIKITPSATIKYSLTVNFYQDCLDVNVEFDLKLESELSISIALTGTGALVTDKAEEDGIKLFGITVATSIPGLTVPITVKFVFEIKGELKVSYKATVEIGFYYDNDNGLTKIGLSSGTCTDVKISGTIYFGLKVSLGCAIIDEDLASISMFGKFGIQITGHLCDDTAGKNKANITGTKNILCTSSMSGDSIHACDTCITGEISLVGSFGLDIKLLDKLPILKFSNSITLLSYSDKAGDYHLSLGEFDPSAETIDPENDSNWLSSSLSKLQLNLLSECPIKAYQITIDPQITRETISADGTPRETTVPKNQLSIKIDDVTIPSGKRVYCKGAVDGKGKSYTAYVTVDGKTFHEDFDVYYSSKTVTVSGTITVNEDGGVISSQDNNDNNNSGEPVSPPATTQQVFPSASSGSKPANPKPAPRTIESIQLGDHITGTIYDNGYLNIYGYGDMYDFNSPAFSHGAMVKQIFFQDKAPEEDLFITSIGNHVFDGFTSLNNSTCTHGVKPTEDILLLPEHLKRIGAYAFKGCSAIKNLPLGKEIESIGEYAFQNCTGITELVIPDSVTAIGRLAFNGCTALTDLTLPIAATDKSYTLKDAEINQHCSVADMFLSQDWSWTNDGMDFSDYSIANITVTGGEVIPSYAFSHMTTLKNIDLSSTSISAIGDYAFWNCNNLTEVKLPKTVTTLGNYSYYGNPITALPDNGAITSAGNYAFGECPNLKKVTVPSTYTSLGKGAFYSCTNLTDLTIPSSVTYMGNLIFNGCTSLVNLEIPYAATSKSCSDAEGKIDQHCSVSDLFLAQDWSWTNDGMDFSDYSISNITVTGGYRIPDYAFSNMTTLKVIDLSKSKIYDINSYAFWNCKNLTTIKLPKTTMNIGGHAFYNTAIPSLPDNGKIKTIGEYAFADCSKLTFTTFPASYTSIGAYAFQNCLGIKKLVVPATVTTLGTQMFNGCTALTDLTLPYAATKNSCALTSGALDQHCSVADLFLSQDWSWDNSDMEFIPSYNLEKITITGGEIIPAYAFSHMTSVKEIDLSGTELTVIGKYAFNDCTALEKITLPDSLHTLGEYAFRNCTALPEITLNDGLDTISGRAFQNCEKITSMIIPDTITVLGTQIFNGCTKLEELQLPYAGTLKSCTFSDGEVNQHCSVADLFLTQDWSWPNDGMDFSNYAIRKITITGGDKIPSYAFSHMQTLEEIDLSNTSINTIGDYAFWNCSKLAEIKIPDTVTSIGNYSYYGTPITKLPDNGHIKTVGSYAFAECQNFGDITIPKSYTSFGSYAFQNCKGIKKLVIPPTVTSLGTQIFNGCTSLKELTLPYAATTLKGTQGDADVNQHCSVADLFLVQNWSWENDNMDFSTYALTKVTITGGDVIPKYAFSGMKYLEEIDLSNTKITTIGDAAFNNCVNLTTLKLPTSLKNINSYAFTNCESMTNFELPKNLRVIGEYAFKNCTGIHTLTIPDSITSMGTLMLNGCTKLETLTIPYAGTVKTCTDMDGDINQHCSVADLFLSQNWSWENDKMDFSPYKIAKITVTGGDKIPQYAFSGMKTLREVDINDSDIELIADYAFNNCPALRYVEVPDGVNFIKTGTFIGDTADVYIYSKDCSIADKSFDEHYAGTIYGYADSIAKKFAAANEYKFVPLDGEVVLGPKDISMIAGDTYTIKSDYTKLEYTSSDKKVATVDENGVISAIAAGKAVINVKASDGKTCDINVGVNAPAKTVTTSTTTTSTGKTTTSTTSTTSKPTTTTSKTTTSTTSTTSKPTTTTSKTTTSTTSTTSKPTTTTSKTTTSTTSTTSKPTTTTSKTTTSTTSTTSKPTTTTSKTTTSTTSTTSKTTTTTSKTTTSTTSTTSKTTTTTSKTTTSTTSTTSTTTTSTTSETTETTTTSTSTTSESTETTTTSTSTTSESTETTTTSTSKTSESTETTTTSTSTTSESTETTTTTTSTTSQPEQTTTTTTTQPITYTPGDINNTGTVDAVDASLILAYYARISTNKEGSFTEAQKLAADVDGDGMINSIDASYVLAFYVYVSTTKETVVTIIEFIKKK
ncbi:leucine-rich repeat protein [Ruminococcus flavefaciens]|uniref:leucine-rich repeat protein n=1 Tax=Ruminococcus flavefaciens TaxID=1265 RepID=UPI0004B585A4|nr:leucine-rich repeat protein [Ruminococcus flavefaciens]